MSTKAKWIRTGQFFIATMIYMGASAYFHWGWSPSLDRFTSGCERTFFFGCGVFAVKKTQTVERTQADAQPSYDDGGPFGSSY